MGFINQLITGGPTLYIYIYIWYQSQLPQFTGDAWHDPGTLAELAQGSGVRWPRHHNVAWWVVRGVLSSSQWIGLREKFNRKAPWSSWENRWFPVKIFPEKPIHWSSNIERPRFFLAMLNFLNTQCLQVNVNTPLRPNGKISILFHSIPIKSQNTIWTLKIYSSENRSVWNFKPEFCKPEYQHRKLELLINQLSINIPSGKLT